MLIATTVNCHARWYRARQPQGEGVGHLAGAQWSVHKLQQRVDLADDLTISIVVSVVGLSVGFCLCSHNSVLPDLNYTRTCPTMLLSEGH